MSTVSFDVDWAALQGAASLGRVRVAVIDSGVDGTHPALDGRVAGQWKYDAEASGWQPILPPGVNNDSLGHGTAVAGIACDVAPNVTIEDYPVLGQSTSGRGARVLSALAHAIAGEARVINMSLSIAAHHRGALLELCEDVHRAGKILIASQRNFPAEDEGHPAQLAACIGVGLHGRPSPFDLVYLKGRPVPFLARGQAVSAPALGGSFSRLTGTSFATPTLTGLCALLLGRYPDLEAFEIKTILKGMALGADPGS